MATTLILMVLTIALIKYCCRWPYVCCAAGGDDSCHASPPFPSLEAISLSGNRVGDWGAVDRLAGLPALRSLRFSANPVTSGLGASEVRKGIAARMHAHYRGAASTLFSEAS